MADDLVARCGVVCAPGIDPATRQPRPSTDAYLVCGEGRVGWLDSDGERSGPSDGIGWLVGVVGGDAPGDGRARSAAAALARIVVRLFQPTPARDPVGVLVRYLSSAHTRMYWTARSEGESDVGGALALAWLTPAGLAWVEVGTARVLLLRDGALRRVSKPWPLGDRQRMIVGSRGLGDDTAVHFSADHNVGLLDVRAGDRLVLGTAGMIEAVEPGTLGATLRHIDDPQVAAVTCLERARGRGSDAAVAVVVLDVTRPGARPLIVEERDDDESTESTVWTARVSQGTRRRGS